MPPHLNTVYTASELARLYQQLPGYWLLLEVLEESDNGRPEKLKLLKYSKDKQELHEFLMDEDENWSWDKKYIFVYANPDKECDLL